MIRGKEEPIEEFLSQIDGQLFIPIYQRKYTWKDEERDYFWRFLEDIDENDENSKHYLHAILTKEHGGKLKSKNKLKRISIIDGQQRVLTSALLYAAICAFCKNNSDVDFDWENEIYNKILIRPGKEGDEKYKIIPKDFDEKTFKMIIDDLPITLKEKAGVSQIIKTYNYFLDKLTVDNVEDVYYKFAHFVIGNDVAEEHDNAQILFETINFAGTPLKEFEMVRCYTLMENDKEVQDKLYYKYWYPLSQNFNDTELTLLFKSYSYYYLKLLHTPSIMKVLEDYKTKGRSNEDFLKDVTEFASKFKKILKCETEIEEVNASLKLIITKKLLIPMCIRLYELYENSTINLNHFINCIKLIEVTYVRLIINNSSTAGTLTRNIFFNLDYSSNAFNELMEKITSKKDEMNVPRNIISDNLFENKLLMSNFYKEYSSAFVKSFLIRLELYTHDDKEFKLDKYEIEHIMPQELNENWKDYLGDDWETIHSENVNRIGNLTLIAIKNNKKLSNKSFDEKLKMDKGYKDDKLYLNKSISSLHHWNQDTIQSRSESIVKKAVEIWSYPTFNENHYLKNQSVLVGSK